MISNANRVVFFGVFFSLSRLFLGAVSAIYILSSGVDILTLGYIKSFQAAILISLGLYAGKISDKIDRKIINILSVFFQ